MKVITDSRCTEYGSAKHPERPQRISGTIQRLRQQVALPVDWLKPQPADDEVCRRAHTEDLLQQLRLEMPFETDSPNYPGIYAHAQLAVGGAILAMETARTTAMAFSLMRPPGHHAMAERVMGFCYLNNIAIATLRARELGVPRVAVIDFDVHHGNGTEAILLDQAGCGFFSIHESPAVPLFSAREDYRQVWEELLRDVGKFKPDMLGVSAGFDPYRQDPLGHQRLEAEDFYWLGETLRRLDLPLFSVLEGGYSEALPELVLAYLTGLEQG
jgi:acetoin utilization deacetylase AcuC-like enzyme